MLRKRWKTLNVVAGFVSCFANASRAALWIARSI
jgi:hypothetical protein